MQELNQTYRITWELPLVVALVSTVLQFAGLADTLRFDHISIDNGHWWLLLSGNIVHLGLNHLILNITGLALVYFLFWSNYNFVTWINIFIFSSAAVGLGLYFLNPELRWYVGLSGALHGLIIAGAISDCRRYPKTGGLFLVLVTGKLAWEQFFGAMPGSEAAAGGHVVVDSHLYGALAGAFCALIIFSIEYLKNKGKA